MQKKNRKLKRILFSNIDYKGFENYLNNMKNKGYGDTIFNKNKIEFIKNEKKENFRYFTEIFPFKFSKQNDKDVCKTHIYYMQKEGFEFLHSYKDVYVYKNLTESEEKEAVINEKSEKILNAYKGSNISFFIFSTLLFMAAIALAFTSNTQIFIEHKLLLLTVFFPVVSFLLMIIYLRKAIRFSKIKLKKSIFSHENSYKFSSFLLKTLCLTIGLFLIIYIAQDVYDIIKGNINFNYILGYYFLPLAAGFFYLIYKYTAIKKIESLFVKFLLIVLALYLSINTELKIIDNPKSSDLGSDIFIVKRAIGNDKDFEHFQMKRSNIFLKEYTYNKSYILNQSGGMESQKLLSEYFDCRSKAVADRLYTAFKNSYKSSLMYISNLDFPKLKDIEYRAFIGNYYFTSVITLEYKNMIFKLSGSFSTDNKQIIKNFEDAVYSFVKNKTRN